MFVIFLNLCLLGGKGGKDDFEGILYDFTVSYDLNIPTSTSSQKHCTFSVNRMQLPMISADSIFGNTKEIETELKFSKGENKNTPTPDSTKTNRYLSFKYSRRCYLGGSVKKKILSMIKSASPFEVQLSRVRPPDEEPDASFDASYPGVCAFDLSALLKPGSVFINSKSYAKMTARVSNF
jgi:hypothetical protein